MHFTKVVYTALAFAGKLTGSASNTTPNPGNQSLTPYSSTPGTLATHTVYPSILPQIEPHIEAYAQQLVKYRDAEKEAKQRYHEKIAARVDYDTAGEMVGSAHLYKRETCQPPTERGFLDSTGTERGIDCDASELFHSPPEFVDNRYWVYRDVTYAISVIRNRYWECGLWGWQTCRDTYIDYELAHRNEKWYQAGTAYWQYYVCEPSGLSGRKQVWQNGRLYDGDTPPVLNHPRVVPKAPLGSLRAQCNQWITACNDYKSLRARYEECLLKEAQRTTTQIAPSPTKSAQETISSIEKSLAITSSVFLQPSSWQNMDTDNATLATDDADASEDIWFDASSEWPSATKSTAIIPTSASKVSASAGAQPSMVIELPSVRDNEETVEKDDGPLSLGAGIGVSVGGTIAMVGTVGVTYYLCQRHRALAAQQPPITIELMELNH